MVKSRNVAEPRRVQVLHLCTWMDIEFMDIKKGDKFRLFEETGEAVYDELYNTEFTANTDAFVKHDVGCVLTDGEFI